MKFWVVFLLIIIGGSLGYFLWQHFPGFHSSLSREDILKSDTVGGKSEQETYNLFISVLKAGNTDEAAGYFALDQNLSRENWVRTFRQLKDKGLLGKMIEDTKMENMEFEFNNYSKVWKIKNL